MPRIQNPTAVESSRVSWNSLVGASTETLTLSRYRAQHLIGAYGISPELAAAVAPLAFGGGAYHG
jgi:hypothetical protein